jgi:hypothetical protein
MKTGPLNLITDVAGLHVGNAEDSRLRSGVTAVLFEQAAVAAVDVRGGGPGTRETDLLAPENTVLRWYSQAAPPLARRSSRCTGAPARAGPHIVNQTNRSRRWENQKPHRRMITKCDRTACGSKPCSAAR